MDRPRFASERVQVRLALAIGASQFLRIVAALGDFHGAVLNSRVHFMAGGCMSNRSSCFTLALILCLGVAVNAASEPSSKGWKPPRTEFGQPDLQGNWNNATITTLERPAQYGSRLVMTADEVAKAEGFAADHVKEAAKPTDPKLGIKDLPNDCGYGFTGTNCGYNNFWVDRGTQVLRVNGEPRASILTQPANGRMPPMTAEAQKRTATRMAARRGTGPLDGPEARGLGGAPGCPRRRGAADDPAPRSGCPGGRGIGKPPPPRRNGQRGRRAPRVRRRTDLPIGLTWSAEVLCVRGLLLSAGAIVTWPKAAP